MDESASYTALTAARAAGVSSVAQAATAWMHKWHIAGTALNWFIFDIVFYANGLFNSDVTSALSPSNDLWGKRLNTLYIVLVQLPGYIVAILTINKLGRKSMQLQGFAVMCLLFFVIGLLYDHLVKSPALFLFLYGLAFFFADFGPNAQIEATSHGLSAAAGKAGATVGASRFELLKPATVPGKKQAMLACSACSLVGLLITVFLTPRYKAEVLDQRDEGGAPRAVKLRWQRQGGSGPPSLQAHAPRLRDHEGLAPRGSQSSPRPPWRGPRGHALFQWPLLRRSTRQACEVRILQRGFLWDSCGIPMGFLQDSYRIRIGFV